MPSLHLAQQQMPVRAPLNCDSCPVRHVKANILDACCAARDLQHLFNMTPSTGTGGLDGDVALSLRHLVKKDETTRIKALKVRPQWSA